MPAQSPYKLYCKYIMIKLHLYTETYDILKYNKKIRLSEKKFNTRKDRFIFNKLANLIDYRDGYSFFVSQLVYRDNITPAGIENNFSLAIKIYERWKKNIAYLQENYEYDLKYIAKKVDYEWKNCFITDGIDYPILFKMVMGQKIHIETYSILEDIFRYYPDALKDDMIYKSLNLKFRKYRMLLNVTTKEMADITPRNLNFFLDNT